MANPTDTDHLSDNASTSEGRQDSATSASSSEEYAPSVPIKRDRVWLRSLLPVLVLAIGIGGTIAIVKSRKRPKKMRPAATGALVEAITTQKRSHSVVVTAHGNVQAKQVASIAAEVSGRITWVNPSFAIGGLVKKGAPLVRLSAVDYQLAVEQSRAQVAQAERSLAEAQSNATVAKREWRVLGQHGGRKEPNPLTLGEPQLKQAQALLASARATLQLSKVRLGRTMIRAPFNLRVRSESVEVGQFVVAGQPFAQVFGVDEAEVLVPLRVADLGWINVPRQRFGKDDHAELVGEGSSAWVTLKVAGKVHRRQGRLVRRAGEIDASGRMTKVVVSLVDPYNLHVTAGGAPVDFEVGSFVEVAIEGRRMDDVVPIPSQALRLGNKVWLATANDTLEIRKVVVGRLTTTEAIVVEGLKGGERLITSSLGDAIDGLKLRVVATKSPAAAPLAEKPNRARSAQAPGSGSARAATASAAREN